MKCWAVEGGGYLGMYHLLQNVHPQHGHVGPPGEVLGGGGGGGGKGGS